MERVQRSFLLLLSICLFEELEGQHLLRCPRAQQARVRRKCRFVDSGRNGEIDQKPCRSLHRLRMSRFLRFRRVESLRLRKKVIALFLLLRHTQSLQAALQRRQRRFVGLKFLTLQSRISMNRLRDRVGRKWANSLQKRTVQPQRGQQRQHHQLRLLLLTETKSE